MGQAEILKFLEDNHNTWFTSREITKGTGTSKTHKPLKKLRELNWVRFKFQHPILYKHKKRT